MYNIYNIKPEEVEAVYPTEGESVEVDIILNIELPIYLYEGSS